MGVRRLEYRILLQASLGFLETEAFLTPPKKREKSHWQVNKKCVLSEARGEDIGTLCCCNIMRT